MTRVLIAGGGTGGHLTPALAIADAIRTSRPDWSVLLVGAERGLEARLLPSRDHRYQLLPAEPVYRRQWWRNWRWPALGLRLRRLADDLLERERPDVVLGTGGYASAPVVWRAAARGLPTAIYESDARPGLATRLLARRVDLVCLAAGEAAARLRVRPGAEVRVTGAPISPPDPAIRERALARFGLAPDRPVVLVTGGSQGALAINRVVAQWIGAAGAAGCQVIWTTGHATHDEFRPFHRPPGVQVFPFLDPMADAYAVATLAVARAGMLTIAELCAWGIPALLIPLPTAAGDHQTVNARVMAEAGAGVWLRQAELTPALLGTEVRRLLENLPARTAMAAAARARGRPGARAEIVALLSRLAAAP